MPRHVLVVDDSPELRDSLCELLQDEGYEVSSAADGRAALEHLRFRTLPHAIVLDLLMPVMDGREFLRRLRRTRSHRQIPIIIVSAVADERTAAELGAAATFGKPLEIPPFLQRLAALTACEL